MSMALPKNAEGKTGRASKYKEKSLESKGKSIGKDSLQVKSKRATPN
jgi:hypothetical protein